MSDPVEYAAPETPDANAPGLIEYLTTGVAGSVVLVLLVLVCYGATAKFGFIWGDDVNVVKNHALRTFGGLSRIWTDLSASPQFMPATYSSFWAEVQLFGVNPLVSHGVNILLHAANVLLLFLLLKRLAVPGAWVAAAVFAVHPLNVEAVAWISERSSLLSLTFGLAAALFYLRRSFDLAAPVLPVDDAAPKVSEGVKLGLPENAGRLYALFLAMFALAVLSRPTLAVLPVVLGVLVWWKKGRLDRRELMSLLPPLILGAAVALLAAHIEHDPNGVGASGPQWELGSGRVVLIGQSIGFYLWKLAAPFPLIFNYPRWDISAGALLNWLPLVGVLALIGIALASISKFGRGPATAVLVYVIAILPVSGIVSYYMMRYAWVADHQAYAASIAPIALVVAAIVLGVRRFPETVGAGISIAVLGIFGFLTATEFRHIAKEGEGPHQAMTFADERPLWEETLKQNPRSWLAAANFGRWAISKGQSDFADFNEVGDGQRAVAERKIAFQRARIWLDEAVKINPNCYEAYTYRGLLDLQQQNPDAALSDFLLADQAAARMNARAYIEPQIRVADILLRRGDTAKAKQAMLDLQALEPQLAARQPETFAQLRMQYGMALMRDLQHPLSPHMSDSDRAIVQSVVEQYLKASDISPEFIPAKLKLAGILMQTDLTTQALEQVKDVLEIDRNNTDAKFLAALTAQKIGDYEAAGAQLVNLLQVDPHYMPAHIKLAEVFDTVGRHAEAIDELKQTLDMAPNYEPAKRLLAKLQGSTTQPATGPSTMPDALSPLMP